MPIVHIYQNKNNTVIPTSYLLDKNLNLREKAILTFLMAKSDDWKCSIKKLSKIFNGHQKAIATAVKELQKQGYLKVTRSKPSPGKFGGCEYKYEILKIDKAKNFDLKFNYYLIEKDMSLNAKGLLTIMHYVLPDDAYVSCESLSKLCHKSVNTISKALQELEVHGYLERKPIRKKHGGLAGVMYCVYDEPIVPALSIIMKYMGEMEKQKKRPFWERKNIN